MIDLDRYLQRIGVSGHYGLPQLQQGHMCHIPFENLDALAGREIRLDLASIESKLVKGGRGGYCFEHNRLFCQVLQQLGWEVRTLAARVRRGSKEIRAHTHMLLEVSYQGAPHLVDVGFGGEGPSTPLPFDGQPQDGIPGVQHRLIPEDQAWVLQVRHDLAEWVDLYAFDLHPHLAVDYEMYNYFTSTHPQSFLTNSMLVALHQPRGFRILFDGLLRVRQESVVTETTLSSDSEVLQTLQDTFGLTAPEGCRLPAARV